MFEQEFENMFADIWFDDRDARIASEEGIGDFDSGDNTFHSLDALIIIRKYDNALKGKHYKSKRNRIIAQRNSIASAFGPEMIDRVGLAS
jgi:hypothetical protein